MKTVTQIFKEVTGQLKTSERVDFISGTIEENNIDESKIETLIQLIKPYVCRVETTGGTREFVYENLQLVFVKLDDLSSMDDEHEKIISECIVIYNQFMRRLRQFSELVVVKEGTFTQIYNDKDANLTGIIATFQLTQINNESRCL